MGHDLWDECAIGMIHSPRYLAGGLCLTYGMVRGQQGPFMCILGPILRPSLAMPEASLLID